jgi:oxygen-independent coproporphyrinogen-3 oxidase
VSLNRIATEFGGEYLNYLKQNAQKFLDNEKLILEDNVLRTTKKGKFFSDGIASDLFWLNLE